MDALKGAGASALTVGKNAGNLIKEMNLSDWINAVKNAYLLILSIQGSFSILGLQFDLVSDIEEISNCAITDNYIEGNTAIQDHIALTPDKLHFIAQVTELKYSGAQTKAGNITSKISAVVGTVGAFATTAIASAQILARIALAIRQGDSFRSILESGDIGDLFTVIQNLMFLASEQARARLFLKSLQQNRIKLSLSTPWGVYQDYYIENMVIRQGNTYDVSTFDITLKQCNFVKIREGQKSKQTLSKDNTSYSAEGSGKNFNTIVKSVILGRK